MCSGFILLAWELGRSLFVRKITRSPRGERLDSGFNEAEPKRAVSGVEAEEEG